MSTEDKVVILIIILITAVWAFMAGFSAGYQEAVLDFSEHCECTRARCMKFMIDK